MSLPTNIEELVKQANDCVANLQRGKADSSQADRFWSLLDNLKAYEKSSNQVGLLASHLSCAWQCMQNLSQYALSPSQTTWLHATLDKISYNISLAATALQQESDEFDTLIQTCLSLNEQINGLELSLFILPHTLGCCNDLRATPANLPDFYSALALFRNYLSAIPKDDIPIVTSIIQLLCTLKSASRLSDVDRGAIERVAEEIAKAASLFLSPTTSEKVKSDLSEQIQETLHTAPPLCFNAPYDALFRLMETQEIKRLKNLIEQGAGSKLFQRLFHGIQAPILSLNSLRQGYAKNELEYILFSSLLHVMNSLRDSSHKLPPHELSMCIKDFLNMITHAIIILEHRPYTLQEDVVAEEALKDFKQDYREIISVVRPLLIATNESH